MENTKRFTQINKFLIPDSSTQSISPSTTMGGHQFIHDSAEHLHPHQHPHNQLSSSTLIMGSNQPNFQIHHHGNIVQHQESSPPEIGSTTTMWEDIASSIKKLDPDHADVLLVASSSSTANVLVHSNPNMSHMTSVPGHHHNFTTVLEGPDHPEMIVTSLSTQGDSHLMQEQQHQQDCNNYVITSLPNNNGNALCILHPDNIESQPNHVEPTAIISSGEANENNFSLAISSMAPRSSTTNAFSSMSFDSIPVSSNAGMSSFESFSSQRDRKDSIVAMGTSGVLSNDQSSQSHSHIRQPQNDRTCQQQHQHDMNQNPSNPSAITNSSPVSSQMNYQQINPLVINQGTHNHNNPHPPQATSIQHHLQHPTTANIPTHHR